MEGDLIRELDLSEYRSVHPKRDEVNAQDAGSDFNDDKEARYVKHMLVTPDVAMDDWMEHLVGEHPINYPNEGGS